MTDGEKSRPKIPEESEAVSVAEGSSTPEGTETTARAGEAEAPLLLPAGESETPEEVKGAAKTEEQGEPEPEAKPRLVVVGIGASAGGLDALAELMPHLPRRDMAFIVVQHLAPDHESMLPRLIARSTELDVVAAADGMPLEPGHVYVITPNVDLAVMHGVIRIVPPPPTPQHLPIDYLFRSLADDLGPSAIGVVLSGTGTDGTFGLKAIRAAGGLTFVQDPATARYDSMPRSALASGVADAALAPAAIGDELARLARQPLVHARPATGPAPQAQDELGRLFVIIRSEFGNDLTNYKLTTIERRIERRMTLHQIGRLADYVKLVQQDPDELRALYDDLLITVTSFFRDPDAFEALKRTVFPKLFENRGAQSPPVRVWVPACATGEEAYSLAISMVEFCEQHGRDSRIQMFGTDVDEACIQHARRGIYAANIAADVSTERLDQFFVPKENEYQVSRRLRDMLVFSRQNVLKDAPFSRMDLVSCRNLLIYLRRAAQQTVLRVLHYALNPSGYLFLGAAETVGDTPELFATVDRAHKIYSKKQVQTVLDLTFGVPRLPEAVPLAATARPAPSLQGLADRKVAELYGPPGVVINEDLEILQFRGHTGRYLDPAAGAASLNLLKVVRFDLHVALRRAVQEAIAGQQRVTTEVSYPDEDKRIALDLDVVPLPDPETKARCLLVSFRPKPPPREVPVVSGEPGEPDKAAAALAQRIRELERDLAMTKEYLQTTLEDKDSTLEELKSANEELQSANEELQSTNQELETSKEEMQSTNEELTTVNDELQNRMVELSQINDDLHNVLAGVDNAVVIVGMDLRIRRYTSAAEKLFNLLPGDVGRSIGFVDPFLSGIGIEAKVSAVIQSLSTMEEVVLATNHRWYALKITPYKTLEYSIRGALVTLVDIDVHKRALDMTRDVGAYADRFLAPIGHPLLIVDHRQRVVWCNDPFLSTFQLTRDEVMGNLLEVLGGRRFEDPGLRQCVEQAITSSSVFHGYILQVRSDGARAVVVAGSRVPAAGEAALALLSFEPASNASPRSPRDPVAAR